MITAKEAKRKILENPTFERKLELYKEVSDIINEAVAKGRNSFQVTEEQHLALNKELVSKGYSIPSFQVLITGVGIGLSGKAESGLAYTYHI